MTSSSEQDNLDLLLDEETNNNCSNTQNGALKVVPRSLYLLCNLTNVNLTQPLALLQNSIQNQPINPLRATLPDSGQNKNIVDSTGKNPKVNGDNDKEEDELF